MKDVNAKTKWAEFDKDEVVWRIKTTGGMTRLRSLLDDVVDEICLFRELRFVAEVFSTWRRRKEDERYIIRTAFDPIKFDRIDCSFTSCLTGIHTMQFRWRLENVNAASW